MFYLSYYLFRLSTTYAFIKSGAPPQAPNQELINSLILVGHNSFCRVVPIAGIYLNTLTILVLADFVYDERTVLKTWGSAPDPACELIALHQYRLARVHLTEFMPIANICMSTPMYVVSANMFR